MQIIPITDTYSQTLTVTLAGQSCRIAIYTKSTGLFCDIYVDDILIIGGVICLDRVKIVRGTYLGFIGDLMFSDTQGAADPVSPGLGSRFLLCYLGANDL